MSQKREVIILEPGSRIRKEGFCSRPVVCPYCGGGGRFEGGTLDQETVACPDCLGTGELVALVTIDWQPNKG